MIERDYNIKSGLYVVGMPIGNLGDITLRALAVLREVDKIICEDTRETSKLLAYYGISKPLLIFNAHSKWSVINEIIDCIKRGEKLALVTDAGTPSISDPGSFLINAVRKDFEVTKEMPPIFAVPGASALVSALSIAGVSASEFVFWGFIPHKKGRETTFRMIADEPRVSVFFESSHRIIKSLNSLHKYLGNKRRVVVCREMTKLYEEVIRGFAKDILSHYLLNPTKVKGEFVVIVDLVEKSAH